MIIPISPYMCHWEAAMFVFELIPDTVLQFQISFKHEGGKVLESVSGLLFKGDNHSVYHLFITNVARNACIISDFTTLHCAAKADETCKGSGLTRNPGQSLSGPPTLYLTHRLSRKGERESEPCHSMQGWWRVKRMGVNGFSIFL
jgi:hypothetical protein